jgi:hypothetical protein
MPDGADIELAGEDEAINVRAFGFFHHVDTERSGIVALEEQAHLCCDEHRTIIYIDVAVGAPYGSFRAVPSE